MPGQQERYTGFKDITIYMTTGGQALILKIHKAQNQYKGTSFVKTLKMTRWTRQYFKTSTRTQMVTERPAQ